MRIDKTLGINQGVNLHIRKNYLRKLLFFIPAGIVFAYGIVYSSIRLFIISFQKPLANNNCLFDIRITSGGVLPVSEQEVMSSQNSCIADSPSPDSGMS